MKVRKIRGRKQDEIKDRNKEGSNKERLERRQNEKGKINDIMFDYNCS